MSTLATTFDGAEARPASGGAAVLAAAAAAGAFLVFSGVDLYANDAAAQAGQRAGPSPKSAGRT